MMYSNIGLSFCWTLPLKGGSNGLKFEKNIEHSKNVSPNQIQKSHATVPINLCSCDEALWLGMPL